MQPFLVPDVPPLLAFGSLVAYLLGLLLVLLLVRRQDESRARRFAVALSCALLVAGVTVYADILILDPCHFCKGLGPGDWEYWIRGCFGCGW